MKNTSLPMTMLYDLAKGDGHECGIVLHKGTAESESFIQGLLQKYGGCHAGQDSATHVLLLESKPDLLHIEAIIKKLSSIEQGSSASFYDLAKEFQEFEQEISKVLQGKTKEPELEKLSEHLAAIDFSKAIKKHSIDICHGDSKTIEPYAVFLDIPDDLLLGRLNFNLNDLRKTYLLSYIKRTAAKWVTLDGQGQGAKLVYANSQVLSSKQSSIIPVLQLIDYKRIIGIESSALRLPLRSWPYFSGEFKGPMILDFYPGDSMPDFDLGNHGEIIIWNHDYHDGVTRWGIEQGIKLYINPTGVMS